MLACRYHCQFGHEDKTKVVQNITMDLLKLDPMLNLKGKQVPSGKGHKGPKISSLKRGDLVKKGCMCSFNVKCFYLQPKVIEIFCTTSKHVNQEKLIVHGTYKLGE
jgi:hypothetical protein